MAQQCRARVSLPNSSGEGDVLFTCNLKKNHAEPALDTKFSVNHREVGRVRSKNGSMYYYTVEWVEAPNEVWRMARTDDGPTDGSSD